MKIAVIGSGISGLGAAHFLSKKHKVDLFEKEDHFGGHSYTTEVLTNKKNEFVSVDLGFIVFNKINYPNLSKLFDKLGVEPVPITPLVSLLTPPAILNLATVKFPKSAPFPLVAIST